MRRMIVAAVAAASLAVPTAALADAGGYGSQPGYGVANSNTQCAGHGAFGAFGTFGTVVHDFGHVYPGDSNGKPGANGAQTGLNNAALCGNRQGNLP